LKNSEEIQKQERGGNPVHDFVMPPRTKLYYVGAVERKHILQIRELEKELDFIWADGMIGMMPVFDNEIKARKYAGDKFEVFNCEIRTA
jgi:hypothetical protein